ncbi:MAG: bifunctional PIG-L family deacetylase/class I SAM-dependent methyltransferase [Microbacterium pygmaeum]
MSAAFSHLDAGTAEEVWRSEERMLGLPDLDGAIADLVVVAAHPDDETLGASGLVQRVHAGGGRVAVIIATDGEGSHPDSPTHSRSRLAARRRLEVTEAIRVMAPDAAVYFLSLADGMLRENVDQLETAIAGILDSRRIGGDARRGAALVVAPWSGDGHRDHRIAAEVVGRVCADRGLAHRGYPIWAWHWGAPEDLPWDRMRGLRLTDAERAAKARAIALHESQLAPLSEAAGDEAIVGPTMRAHFERDIEVFIDEMPVRDDAVDGARGAAESMPGDWFEEFYGRNDDPWGFETRWYEQRKRDVLMACLPTARIGAVLEIGCATGMITERLLERADTVVSIDPAATALDAARRRVGDDPRVSLVQAQVPKGWPGGMYDTIVLSEVAYYLSLVDLAEMIELISAALAGGGSLVACHWRHPVREYPLTGDEVHEALRAHPAWEATVRHEEKDFVLEVFSARPARSVAEREGLV